MKQPTKTKRIPEKKRTVTRKKPITVGELIKKRQKSSQRKHPKYGTSKLEDRFAKEFLDKLDVSYKKQFEAKDIGRFYDFIVKTKTGAEILIEIDGDYFHSYGLTYEEKNPMQKHNEYVDKQKNEWARVHKLKLIRIWEHDILHNPSKVMKMLIEEIGYSNEKELIRQDKKKRH